MGRLFQITSAVTHPPDASSSGPCFQQCSPRRDVDALGLLVPALSLERVLVS